MSGEVVLLDDTIRPHAAHEFILAEDRAVRVEEGHQRIERAAPEPHRTAVGQQFTAMADDLEPAKCNGYGMIGLSAHVVGL